MPWTMVLDYIEMHCNKSKQALKKNSEVFCWTFLFSTNPEIVKGAIYQTPSGLNFDEIRLTYKK